MPFSTGSDGSCAPPSSGAERQSSPVSLPDSTGGSSDPGLPVRRAAAKSEKAHVPTTRQSPPAENVAASAVSEKKIVTVPPAERAVERAPILDRWQLLTAGLDRCSGRDLFARGTCEQLARAQYCEGYWGQVAMCPGGIGNDHGQ